MKAPGWCFVLGFGLALQSLSACTAKIGGDSANGTDAVGVGNSTSQAGAGGPGISVNGKVCGGAKLPPARIWRLTSKEYLASARDLLGLEAPPDIELEVEPIVDGYKNNANALSVSTRFAGQLQKAGETLAAPGLAQFPRYSGCDASAVTDQACVQKFIQNFGARAFRRPLTPEETSGYLDVYRAGVLDAKAAGGVRLVVQTLLQSPYFLYRSELGTALLDDSSAPVRLNGYELASELSYSLWGTPPDDKLLAAAASGALTSTAELESQGRRLLSDPRARSLVSDFASQWLSLQDPSAPLRDPTQFPEFAAVKTDMFAEFAQLSQELFLGAGATLGAVFSSKSTFVTKSLADYYGLPAVAAGGALQSTSLLGTPRSGLLTSGALIASWSRDVDTAPMSRGRRILDRVLCQALPPPPAALDIPAIPQLVNATTRERYTIHAQNPLCTGCHTTLDGVAFALENFDSLGRYRSTENGKPIDASGQIQNGGDADGPFSNMAEFASRLSGSASARACLARQYVRFAVGTGTAGDDDCLIQGLVDAATKRGDSPTELLVALITSDFFRARRPQ